MGFRRPLPAPIPDGSAGVTYFFYSAQHHIGHFAGVGKLQQGEDEFRDISGLDQPFRRIGTSLLPERLSFASEGWQIWQEKRTVSSISPGINSSP